MNASDQTPGIPTPGSQTRRTQTPGIVRWTLRLEEASALDGPVEAVRPKVQELFGSGTRGALLRGEWLGHAVHPVLTDLPIGTWTSATLLDLFGGPQASAAAQRLVGIGLLAVAPTAWTGWAEWSASGPREQRVGLVHAATVATTGVVYAASWVARRRGHHDRGARLALVGATLLSAGAYLGGHLASARQVASHDRAYDGAASS